MSRDQKSRVAKLTKLTKFKRSLLILGLFGVLQFGEPVRAGEPVKVDEDWKGKSDESQVGFGGLTGMGIIDSSVGYALLGTASKKIVSRGFVPDVNDSVWIEGALGPVFLSGATAIAYSAHLRWDFIKDAEWTLYALGGVGGNYLSVASSSRYELFPRFGVGAFWNVISSLQLRGEITHDLIAIGVNVPL